MRSGRPGWCRKNPPFSEAPCPVILKSTISYPTFLSSSPYRRHKKNTPFPILWEDETNVQECQHMVKWGVQRVASEPPQAPRYYTSPFREIGQQEDLLANLMQHVFTYSWFEMTWNYPTWGKFSYLTFVFYCFSTLVIK